MTELGVLAPAGELVDPRRHLLEEAGHSGETLVELPNELSPLGLEPLDRPGDVTRLDRAVLRNDVALDRPLPQRILVDNGTPFTSKPLDAWAYWNQVKLDSSRRGKPGDNAHIEAFNSLVRRECLSQHLFMSLEEAGGILERWKEEYNNDRPHGSLRQMPPARYRAGGIPAQDRDELDTRRLAGSEKR